MEYFEHNLNIFNECYQGIIREVIYHIIVSVVAITIII